MSWTNQETFQSTVQAHNGTTSLYHDGTAAANNTDQPMFTIPDIDFTSDFTIEFFQYTDGSGLISPVTISGRDSSKYIIFWPNSTSAFLQWFKPSDDGVIFKSFSVSPTMLGRWVHMAMSYDSVTDTVHFAVDGVVNSYTEGLSTVFMTGTDVPQADFLVWPQNHTFRVFNGYVDDFRVTQSALYTTAYTVPDPVADGWAVGGTTLYYEDMEPPIPGMGVIVPRVIGALVPIVAVSGATTYSLTYQSGVDSETLVSGVEDAISSGEDLVVNVTTPLTLYTLTLFVDGVSFQTQTFTTLANSSENYNTVDFGDSVNGFDLSNLGDSASDAISEVLDDLFFTGNPVTVKTDSGETVSTEFVNLGASSGSIEDLDGLLIPFDTIRGSSQAITMTLSSSTTPVLFIEGDGTITIGGTPYAVGDTLILDGRKVKVRGI